MSIHSSGASKLVLDALEAHRLKGVVLHWWRGTAAQTHRGLELGCHFSINAAEVTRPKVLDSLRRDRVLTETDHPYGDRSEAMPRRPGQVHAVEVALAERWNVDITVSAGRSGPTSAAS